ncbi:IDEAL domain-containing protein [Domibacillus epiphyticus]|uniref:IDEAL domain-containing protein n=1 Tax=Domibacillus epiphyticus TaxID=1714355 RepID=A0A1V2A558_9BACI|nr:IDEAL domain-containing protein [Domibacillus epiphyticus]OMP66151.1 hypothetical protein BTO28_14200 [Domibacillus epiphyticus]
MSVNRKKYFEEGDWVKGRTREGELIRGYVVQSNDIQEIIKVTVVECDNEKTVGRTIRLMDKSVEKLPVVKTENEEQIHQLIDLALLTKDEEWFVELATQLKETKEVYS